MVIYQTKIKDPNVFNNLSILYIENKLTQVIRSDKNITAITSKLKKVYADW